MTGSDRPPVRRRRYSPITWRILAVNALALAVLVAGLLYLGEYRRILIGAELTVLRTHAKIFAAALAEGASIQTGPDAHEIYPPMARQMVRGIVRNTSARARLFAPDGTLMADSRRLLGGYGTIEIERLPPPPDADDLPEEARGLIDRVLRWLPGRKDLEPYEERLDQKASDYPEAVIALKGEIALAERASSNGDAATMLSVAVPVKRYKKVMGALMVTADSRRVDAALLDVRVDILMVSGLALTISVMLSLYLAASIARPLVVLSRAAERVRSSVGRSLSIPDLSRRNDEIGDLSYALRDMTQALWTRMDAIERFAADVSHEIKNPLGSLRSAVETAARIDDPEQQKRLMSIILDDVQRLNRLITDISDASRLDAELSRAEQEPVDLGRLVATLADVYRTTGEETGGPDILLDLPDETARLRVSGIEDRLVQVFRNLIINAVSFSPPGGTLRLAVRRDGERVEVTVDDDGPGLPPGKEEAIFARFYSERPEGEKFGTHSGLGLSISRQIVEALGGRIEAGNRLDRDGDVLGARFRVRLPAEDA